MARLDAVVGGDGMWLAVAVSRSEPARGLSGDLAQEEARMDDLSFI